MEKKIMATNKKASFDYHIHEVIEAGIALVGSEVRAIFDGKMNLKNSYVTLEGGEAFLVDCHVGEHHGGFEGTHEPLRERKLLLHKKEISKLIGVVSEKGYTVVPLSCYRVKGKVKLEIAVAEGKKKWDKRQDIAEKEAKRRIERVLKYVM